VQPGRGGAEVPGQPLQARQPLLRLAPQQQGVGVLAGRGVAEHGDRRRDGDAGMVGPARVLLDLRPHDQQGGLVFPAAQPSRLQDGQAPPGSIQRSREISLIQRGQRFVPQRQRLLCGAGGVLVLLDEHGIRFPGWRAAGRHAPAQL